MPKIFLAPRSGERSAEHFQKTVEGGYRRKDLEGYLSPADRKALAHKEVVFIWGNRPGTKTPWDKMEVDDYIFFYQKGRVPAVGKLLYKSHNKELATKLWGLDPVSKEYWEYVFFVDGITNTDIDFQILRNLAGHKPNDYVQGFRMYKPEGVANMIEKYGSIEKFIDAFRVGQSNKSIPIVNKDEGGAARLLKTKKQIVLFGPPGTGKTHSARIIAVKLLS